MKTLEEIKKEFEHKFLHVHHRISGDLSYDYSSIEGDPDDVWNFIESTISQIRDESYEVGYREGEGSGHHDVIAYLDSDEENWQDAIKEIVSQTKQELIEEMIKLSDRIESGQETSMEEWKAFKHFRNTMRDVLQKLSNK